MTDMTLCSLLFLGEGGGTSSFKLHEQPSRYDRLTAGTSSSLTIIRLRSCCVQYTINLQKSKSRHPTQHTITLCTPLHGDWPGSTECPLVLTLLSVVGGSNVPATPIGIAGTTNTPNRQEGYSIWNRDRGGVVFECLRECQIYSSSHDYTHSHRQAHVQCQTSPIAASFFRLSFRRDALEKTNPRASAPSQMSWPHDTLS